MLIKNKTDRSVPTLGKAQMFLAKQIVFLALLFSGLSLSGQGSDRVFYLNIKGGLDFSGFTDHPKEIEANQESGYRAGLDVRLGSGVFFFQPGVYFTAYKEQFTVDFPHIDLVNSTQEINLSSIKVPVQLGARLLSTKAVTLRLNGGFVANFPVAIDESNNSIAIRKEDYSHAHVAGVLGAGIDLLFFTFDINYEYGISDYIEFSSPSITSVSSKQYVLSFCVGFRL